MQDHRHRYNAINIDIDFASAKKHDANAFRRLARSVVLPADVAGLSDSFRKIIDALKGSKTAPFEPCMDIALKDPMSKP